MNRESFAIGMMEYGGIGLLIMAGLFVGALDLAMALFTPTTKRCRISRRQGDPNPGSPSMRRSKRSQTNQ